MIYPYQFRLGNLINNSDGPAEIVSISKEAVVAEYLTESGVVMFTVNVIYVDPVPLTEEWLLKFGWVWNEECNSFEKYPNGDARMNLKKREVDGSYTMFNHVLRAMIAERIYFVHQLQNLYFALSGEELKVKEIA